MQHGMCGSMPPLPPSLTPPPQGPPPPCARSERSMGRGAARPPGTRAVTAVAGATESVARPSADSEGPAGCGGVMNTLRLGESRIAAWMAWRSAENPRVATLASPPVIETTRMLGGNALVSRLPPADLRSPLSPPWCRVGDGQSALFLLYCVLFSLLDTGIPSVTIVACIACGPTGYTLKNRVLCQSNLTAGVWRTASTVS
jgi:hypothetical protein